MKNIINIHDRVLTYKIVFLSMVLSLFPIFFLTILSFPFILSFTVLLQSSASSPLLPPTLFVPLQIFINGVNLVKATGGGGCI